MRQLPLREIKKRLKWTFNEREEGICQMKRRADGIL